MGRFRSFSQRLTVLSSRLKNAAISFQESNRWFSTGELGPNDISSASTSAFDLLSIDEAGATTFATTECTE